MYKNFEINPVSLEDSEIIKTREYKKKSYKF